MDSRDDGIFSALARWVFSKGDYLFEAEPRAANAKAFHVSAYWGKKLMNTRFGPYISKFGRASYPFILAVVAPTVPRGINQIIAKTLTRKSFWFWFFTAMFFCFVLNALLTCKAGTFARPSSLFSSLCPVPQISVKQQPHQYYFMQDIYNLFLYLVVVPLYVAFDIRIIKLFVTTWPDFKRFADNVGSQELGAIVPAATTTGTNKRIAGYFIVVTLVVVGFITNYINDILLTEDKVSPVYWFIHVTSDGKTRVLNSVGAYYLIMNATLLFLTVSALWCYISISIEIARYGKNAGFAQANNPDYALKHDSHVLLFTKTLIYMKILVAIYAVNVFVWSQSPLKNVDNAFISLVALLLVMTIFIPAPRIYLEYRWHALRSFSEDGYEDTRTRREKWTTRGLDWLVFGLLLWVAEEKFPGIYNSIHDAIVGPFKYLWHVILQIFPAS